MSGAVEEKKVLDDVVNDTVGAASGMLSHTFTNDSMVLTGYLEKEKIAEESAHQFKECIHASSDYLKIVRCVAELTESEANDNDKVLEKFYQKNSFVLPKDPKELERHKMDVERRFYSHFKELLRFREDLNTLRKQKYDDNEEERRSVVQRKVARNALKYTDKSFQELIPVFLRYDKAQDDSGKAIYKSGKRLMDLFSSIQFTQWRPTYVPEFKKPVPDLGWTRYKNISLHKELAKEEDPAKKIDILAENRHYVIRFVAERKENDVYGLNGYKGPLSAPLVERLDKLKEDRKIVVLDRPGYN